MPSFEPARVVLRREERFVPTPLPAPSGAGGRAAPPASATAEALSPHTPAPTDAEAIRQAAYEEGLAAGRAERPDEDVAALGSALRVLEEAAAGLGALRRSYLHAHRHAVIELALAVAERLLGRALAAEPEALAELVERALAALGDTPPTAVQLARADLARLEADAAPELARIAREHGVAFEVDERLAAGDVRVRAGMTEVDARLTELLRRFREELAEAIPVEEASA